MNNTNLAGNMLLSNIKNKRFELDSLENDIYIDVQAGVVNDDIYDGDIDIEIDLNDYMNKPIGMLLSDVKKQMNKEELEFTNFSEESDIEELMGLEFIYDDVEDVNIDSYFGNEGIKETVYYDIDTEESFLKVDEQIGKNIDTGNLDEIKRLKRQLEKQKEELYKRDKELEKLQMVLMLDENLTVSEEYLENKSLSKVEQLLLDKRGELVERQKASKKNWFFKILDKVKS
ncbi:hypothetical protein [uncultured Clostridium sp.]|uniref:hypothetical protein n=1 Tax=uncultured Clostridium sp. TaxID=59620 RepID=UPI002635BCA0|nr:hypothetical protein [uncultured Clostridium sp.]